MARTFKDIEEQMASVGIYIPPGFELYPNKTVTTDKNKT